MGSPTMHIKSVVKTSLIDFPNRLASIVFVGGCNFRCPFCQNAELVLRPGELPDLPVEEVLASLRERRGFVDGLVISGGEPTLEAGLFDFAREVAALGLAIKLDTNGYRPDALGRLLEAGLLEFVAMDIKAAPDRYAEAAGLPALRLERIRESLDLLRASPCAHELRTTVVPGLVAVEDADALAELVHGAQRYVLQQYRPDRALVPALQDVTPYTVRELEELAARLNARGVPTTIRGV